MNLAADKSEASEEWISLFCAHTLTHVCYSRPPGLMLTDGPCELQRWACTLSLGLRDFRTCQVKPLPDSAWLVLPVLWLDSLWRAQDSTVFIYLISEHLKRPVPFEPQ